MKRRTSATAVVALRPASPVSVRPSATDATERDQRRRTSHNGCTALNCIRATSGTSSGSPATGAKAKPGCALPTDLIAMAQMRPLAVDCPLGPDERNAR